MHSQRPICLLSADRSNGDWQDSAGCRLSTLRVSPADPSDNVFIGQSGTRDAKRSSLSLRRFVLHDHMSRERSVLPEYGVHTRLQVAQQIRVHVVESEQNCGTSARSSQPL